MGHYYFEKRGHVAGPFSLKQLKKETIVPGTLVWQPGGKNWMPAKEIKELSSLFIKQGPASVIPASLKKNKNAGAPVYDERYRQETDITKTGIFMMLTPVLFLILYKRAFYNSDYFSYIKLISITGALLIRTIATVWVMRAARNQNRNANNWALAAMFFPAIAMIAIGLTKKLYDPEDWKNHLYNKKREKSNAYFHAAVSEQYS